MTDRNGRQLTAAGELVMEPMSEDVPLSRFATREEVFSDRFTSIVRELDRITAEYGLPDHSDVNEQRYPWSRGLIGSPAFYAARMWEYPFAVLSADLHPGMLCADIGCGMTAFTVYLKEIAKCATVGLDPDVFAAGIRYKGHGVSREFVRRTGLSVAQCGMEAVAVRSCSFDRVFCLSVIEHLPAQVVRLGLQEMARILKPGGRLVITVDTNLCSEISRPFDLLSYLVWDCGLVPCGKVNFRWPRRRFGVFDDGRQPADVYGMTLVKENYLVETEYHWESAPVMEASDTPALRAKPDMPTRELSRWRRGGRDLRNGLKTLLRGR